MINCWVWSTISNHWYFAKSNGIWGGRSTIKTKKFKIGDLILFYDISEHMFVGIAEIRSSWKNDNNLTWPEEIEKHEILYTRKCNIKTKLVFELSFQDAKFLKFIRDKPNAGFSVKNSKWGGANNFEPISYSDIAILGAYLWWNDVHPGIAKKLIDDYQKS